MNWKRLFPLSVFLFLFVAVLEIGIRLASLDLLYLRSTLYYSSADEEVHRPSADANLLYELIPLGKIVQSNCVFPKCHPKETPGYTRTVTINEWGYRFSPWKKEKPPGVFRIVMLGGSNTYGYVSDEDTCTYQLAQTLNKLSPGKFEVWNAGLTASVLSQKVVLARKAIAELDPDLIIFKHFFNTGRRAFYVPGKDTEDVPLSLLENYFSENPELFTENIPFLFNDIPTVERVHRNLVQISATYRLIHALINAKYVKLELPHHAAGKCEGGEKLCNRIFIKYTEAGDLISDRDFERFLHDFPDKKIFMFDPVNQLNCKGEARTFHNLPILSLCTEEMAPEYRDIHPPSYVYKFYAKVISDYLVKNKLVPL